VVTPCLERLAEKFGETAQYAERKGAEVIYRGKVNPTGQAVQMTSTIGGRNPVHCTGVGKALLAWSRDATLAPAELEASYGPFDARTPKTIVDPTGAISVSALAHRLPLERLVARTDEIRAIVTGALGDVMSRAVR